MIEILTFDEIKEIIESNLFVVHGNGPSSFMNQGAIYINETGNFTRVRSKDSNEFVEKLKKLGKIKEVEHYGGEGQGDNYLTIYHFIDHDVYILFSGNYQSYNGAEYEGMYEVEPVEVTKIEYKLKGKPKKLTFAEIEKIIESDLFDDNENGPQAYFSDEIYDATNIVNYEGNDTEFVKKIKELGSVKRIDSYGGEGCGDDYWSVYHFVNHDVYIKFCGNYQSYEGSEYEGMYEVKPVEVLKTEYQPVR
jgi:hypothetical protein